MAANLLKLRRCVSLLSSSLLLLLTLEQFQLTTASYQHAGTKDMQALPQHQYRQKSHLRQQTYDEPDIDSDESREEIPEKRKPLYSQQQYHQQQQQQHYREHEQQFQQPYQQQQQFSHPQLQQRQQLHQQQPQPQPQHKPQQYEQRRGPHYSNTSQMKSPVPLNESSHNKCRIWIPSETFNKYPLARKMQDDQLNRLLLIEICCSGYGPILWGGSTVCRPVCENCRNGFCGAPGVCTCYDEFIRNDNGDCVFACPLGCQNGQCYLDGTCQCDPGYKLDESRKFCRPICSGGCGINPAHNCTEPEVCGCAKGYQLMDEGCMPTCQPNCGIGGRCRAYNQCECHPGYTLQDGVCQADCYQKCTNGICYSRNRCICKPGFTYHESSTQCIPL